MCSEALVADTFWDFNKVCFNMSKIPEDVQEVFGMFFQPWLVAAGSTTSNQML